MKIEKINELFGRFAERLLKMRWMTLGIFALVIILSVIGMKRMVKETSFDDYFIEDDPIFVFSALISLISLLMVASLSGLSCAPASAFSSRFCKRTFSSSKPFA